MAMDVKKNSKAQGYPDVGDTVDATIGRREWKLSFGETDADTRDKRVNRKASVTTLSPKLAIVNVYQLINKRSRTLHNKRGVVNKGKQGKMGRPSGTGKQPKAVDPGVYGYKLPAQYEGDNGELLNMYGNPITTQDESRHEYNTRVAEWRRQHKLDVKPKTGTAPPHGNKSKSPPQSEEPTEAQAEAGVNYKAAEAEAKTKRDAYNATLPNFKLWEIVKSENAQARSMGDTRRDGAIRTDPSFGSWKNDKRYSQRDPVADYDRLVRAINTLKAERKLKNPTVKGEIPPIVAIQPSTGRPPQWYFVRNDISESRKRKMVKVQAKRPVKKLLPHGNKRKVVMRKGGKR
jgi:hypothetical protein